MAACASVAFGQREVSVGKPFINVSGLTKLQNGSYACLVGQQIGCQMGFLGTAPPLPTYSWTLPPNVFDSYIVQNTSAVENLVQSSQLTQSSITFCFSPISGLPQTQEETVSCTATSGSNQYTASATIEVEEPSVATDIGLDLGDFEYLPSAASPTSCQVWGTGFYVQNFGYVGAALTLTTSDPPDFVAIGQTGQWIFVQCVVADLSGTYYTNGVQDPLQWSWNNEFVCDGGVPFPDQLVGTGPTIQKYFYQTGQEGTYFDGPGVSQLNTYGQPVNWSVSFSLSPYIFYYPPSTPNGQAQPVPLEVWPWSAAGAGASGNPWTLSPNDKPPSAGVPQTAPAFPQWTELVPLP